MRTFTLILALALSHVLPFVPVPAVSAKLARRYPTPTTKSPVVPDALALRQHHERRALLDVCAYIDLDLGLGGDLLGLPTSELAGLKLCLCLSALPLVLDTNVQLKALGDKYGNDLVNAVLKLLLNTSPNSRHCTYPDHSDPVCSSSEPCGFHCHEPYVREGNQCVCAPPYISCNGNCIPASQGCGSAVPRSLNARSDSLLSRAQASCKAYETVCGVYGSNDKNAFDCVDTQRDLESCGGCMAQNPFVPYNASATVGRDCTSIPGVETVSCLRGGCHVQSCSTGWTVNGAKDGCLPVHGSGGHRDALKLQPVKRKTLSSRLFVDRAEPEEESHGSIYPSAFYD